METLREWATRVLFLGTEAENAVWLSVAWAIVITLVFATLSIWRFRRAVAR